MTITKIEKLILKVLFFSIYDEEERSYRVKTVSEQWHHQALVDDWAVLK